LIEAANDADREAHLLAIGIDGEVERIDHGVHDVSEQVAHGGRPDNGYEEVGSRTHAVAAQGVAKRTRTMGQSGLARHVDHARDTHRRIHHEPSRGRPGAGGAQLEHVIENDDRLTEIDQDVVNGLADGPGRQGAIDDAKDSQPLACQRLLDGEAPAVNPLEWIVWRRRRRGMTGVGDRNRRHRHGGDQP
jgi:hypothetical protein